MPTKKKRINNRDDVVFDKYEPIYIVCCDCGLVHKFRLMESDLFEARVRISRMNKMTEEERLERKKISV